MNQDALSSVFKDFARKECRNSSKLYEYLSLKIADDREILALAGNANSNQPVPNLLFGAVHYLLLKKFRHELAQFYPTLVTKPRKVEDAFPVFKDFCTNYQKAIIDILKTKRVQTNEVRRCSYLYPVFCYIHQMTQKPLALVEIGTSAGLQLFWDQYCYSYGDSHIYGNTDSEVSIHSEIVNQAAQNLPLSKTPPPVTSRIGIDFHPVDLTNDEDYLWLNALIWPEHRVRRTLFEKAANNLRIQTRSLIKGDGVGLLPEVIRDIPMDHSLVIFHTHVANQMPEEVKNALIESIQHIAGERDIFHLYNNMSDRHLHLDYFMNQKQYKRKVCETDGHGRWFSWEM